MVFPNSGHFPIQIFELAIQTLGLELGLELTARRLHKNWAARRLHTRELAPIPATGKQRDLACESDLAFYTETTFSHLGLTQEKKKDLAFQHLSTLI